MINKLYSTFSKSKIEKLIKHNDIPIKLNISDEFIKYFLWYSPINASFQATENVYVKSGLFDNFLFELLIKDFGLSFKTDAIFVKNFNNVKFEELVSDVDQKIVLCKYKGETKTTCLLRHLRNAIAHGRFNVFNNIGIFVDIKSKSTPDYTAIIVLKIENIEKLFKLLLNFNNDLNNESIQTSLFEHLFKELGYKFNLVEKYNIDMELVKNRKRFNIEIKKHIKDRYYNERDLNKFLNQSYTRDEKSFLVLLIFLNTATKKARKMANENNIIILDKEDHKKMLEGEDILWIYSERLKWNK